MHNALRQRNRTRVRADPGTDNRDLLGTVFETMGDGMCTLHKDGRLILMNPQAEKMLGWGQADIYGELILDAIYPIGSGPLSPTQKLFQKLEDKGEIDFPEAIFRTSSGHILNVAFSLSAITHRDKFAGAVLVFRDISTILHAQAELSHQLLCRDGSLLLHQQFFSQFFHGVSVWYNQLDIRVMDFSCSLHTLL